MNEQFHSDEYFSPSEFLSILARLPKYETDKNEKTSVEYIRVACGFDIETTSFYEGDEKRGIMYEWTFGIDGYIIIGRHWEDFIKCINQLRDFFQLTGKRRILIGVHNLSFEFQFMRKWFDWDKVFAIDKRKPVYAITDGVEFRCTYILTGLSLEKVAEDILAKWNIKKLKGDLDYYKIRHSETRLTKKEIQYCINDVKIVMALMEEKARQDGGYNKIPITKTAYVRNRCRDNCFGLKRRDGSYNRYRRAISTLKLTVEDYDDLKDAFQGGFTHCNYWWSGDKANKVSSFDFTSSYPTVMITMKYPIAKPLKWSEEKIKRLYDENFLNETMEEYCCLFTIHITGLKEDFKFEHYLSESRCNVLGQRTIDNGRIVKADEIYTTITEQDFKIIRRCYKWDKLEFIKVKTFIKGYLPTDFVKTIVELYKIKTELKGVEGKEEEYMSAKGDLNSLYGMAVMDIIRDENKYEDEWLPEEERDKEELIDKYNNNKWRFLYYPWGVWVTAYARANLWTGIFEFGKDYIYSDTDSLKVVNAVNHLEYFSNYNFQLTGLIKAACEYHKIPEEDLRPKTKDGIEKPIGVWDYEGTYSNFKSLGAKRYMYTSLNKKTWKDELHLTVAGLNKKVVVPYLLKKYKNNIDKIFDKFRDGMTVPAEKTGKLTHTYIDEEHKGIITDYRGLDGSYYEKTAVHLEASEYNLGITAEYTELLLSILNLKIGEG